MCQIARAGTDARGIQPQLHRRGLQGSIYTIMTANFKHTAPRRGIPAAALLYLLPPPLSSLRPPPWGHTGRGVTRGTAVPPTTTHIFAATPGTAAPVPTTNTAVTASRLPRPQPRPPPRPQPVRPPRPPRPRRPRPPLQTTPPPLSFPHTSAAPITAPGPTPMEIARTTATRYSLPKA